MTLGENNRSCSEEITHCTKKLSVLPGDQSAYGEFHSTETALRGIVSDLLEYINEGKCAILILLDLSAIFDTVDHELLTEDLMHIDDEEMALECFKNYLENTSYHVIINEIKSTKDYFKEVCHRGVFWDQFYFPFIW